MAKEVKLKVVSVKSLTHLMVKEIGDTDRVKSYLRLEFAMQQTYAINEDHQSLEDIDRGSVIAVLVNPYPKNKKNPKIWVRAVVKQIFQTIGTYLFDVSLIDFGTDAMVNGRAVRYLKNHFTEEFVERQILNFHLTDVLLKPDVNTKDNIKLLEDLFESNDWTVSAIIEKEMKTHLKGTIKFENRSDLNKILVSKGLAIEKETQFRSPKTVPVFKNITPLPSTSKQLNYSFETSSETKRNSLSSVSSTELSVCSNDSVNSTEEADIKVKNPKVVQKVSFNGFNNMNKDVPQLNGRFAQLFLRAKESQMKKNCGSNATTTDSGSGTIRSSEESTPRDSPVDFSVHFNSKPDHKVVDWQLNGTEEVPRKPLAFRPAGLIPPPHVLERIYTLKKNNN